MKKPKALMSAILTCAILASAAVPAAADTVGYADSKANASVVNFSADESGDPSTFSWDNATVYFLLTDRFLNADKTNDNAYGRQDINVGDTRATFHGGDFAGITQKIEEGYFNDLGVNAIWLTAPYEQIHGYIQGGPNFYHYSYHGYYLLDYTQTDKAYGTEAEFQKLVDTAHEHGIRIVMDIVMNHAGYCSMYDMNEYGFGDLMDGWDTFYKNPSSNAEEYQSYMGYTQEKSGNPNCGALWAKWWGPDWIRSDVEGYSLGTDGSEYTQSLTGLPDFRTEQTTQVGIPPLLQTKWGQEGTLAEKTAKYGSSNTVTGYITTWLSEWVRTYGVDGFRCDTAKHVEMGSWKQLKDACVSALREWKAANPTKKLDDLDFWMTGECWNHGLGYDDYYKSGAFDSMINFSMSGGGSLAAATLADVYQGYADQINSKDDFNALTFISSHDETLARGDLYYLGSSFLMLPGCVQIFYGDETNRGFVDGVPFDGNGGAGHSLRSDMNWDSIDEDVLAHWQKVGTFRNSHIAVGGGDNIGLTSSEGVAFGRTYSKNGIKDKVAGVVGAGADTDVTIDVSDLWEEGTVLVNAYDDSTGIVTDGEVTFGSGAHGTILIEEPKGGVLVSLKGASKFTDTQELTVYADGVDTVKISVDGGKKFLAKNGDTFTIGQTAYPGDTVKVTLEYTDDKGNNISKTLSFKKEDPTGTVDKRSDNAIVHVYSNVASPNIYAWQGEGTEAVDLAGKWPGTALSAKDDDGWFVIDLGTTDSYNVIINAGGGQSGDVKGLQGETWLVVSDSFGVKKYTDRAKAIADVTGEEIPESDFSKLKAVCRQIKNLTDSEYTSSTYSAAIEKVAEADVVILKGEDAADADEVTKLYKEVTAAKDALVLAAPVVKTMAAGDNKISGTAACEAEVTVKVDGKTYTATADDITGEWSVSVSALSASSEATVSAKNAVAESDPITVKVGEVQNVVDKSALKAKLDEAKKLIEQYQDIDGSDRIADAVYALQKAVDAAQKVYDDSSATQSEVDAQVKALDDAIKAFNSSITDTDTSTSDTDTNTNTDTDTASDTDTSTDKSTDEDKDTDTDTNTDSDKDTDTDKPGEPGSGDVNGDGKVSLKDASLIQKYYAGLIDLTEDQKKAADMNGDGRVNLADAYALQIKINANFRK